MPKSLLLELTIIQVDYYSCVDYYVVLFFGLDILPGLVTIIWIDYVSELDIPG